MGWLSLVGAGISAFSALEQGNAQQQSANYNAAVARNNAIHAAQAGEAQAQDVSLKGAMQLGRIKASQGANNITIYDPAKGASTRAVQQSSREATAVSATNAENNALVQAYGYNAEAALDKSEGQQAMIGGVLGAAGDVASGVGGYFGGGSGGGGSGEPSSTNSQLGQSLQATAAPTNWAGSDSYATVG